MNLPKFDTVVRIDKSLVDVKCSTWATFLVFVSVTLLSLAFLTPLWLQSETIPGNQKFDKLGLFQVCFTRFQDHHYRYDRIIEGCKFIFDEDLSFLSDFLEQPTMGRHSSRSASRSQHPEYETQHKTVARQQHMAPSRERRNIEHQLKLDQRAALKASFGANASQLKLTVYILLALALVLMAYAFFSTQWLEAEKRYYGSKFRKLGLWRMCFKSFSAPDDFQFKKFYVGCRWIFADEYKPIRGFLLPAFFISTQVLFTAGFLLLVLVCAGIIAVQQCFIIEREDYALRALSVASLISAISCTCAVIIFALYADREDWMPDPEHNYLSWSFASALIGSVILWVAALLFYIEMQLTIRRDSI